MNIAVVGVLLLCLCAITEGQWLKRGKVKTNCAVDVWRDWKCTGSTCGRFRLVTRPAKHGGIPCPRLHQTKQSSAKDDPWNQNKAKVVPRVQSKIVAGTKRYITVKGKVAKASADQIVTHTQILLPRDLLVLLDMSGSIGKKDFELTKRRLVELIEKLCGKIGKGPQNNRISVVSFSTNVKLNFDFKTVWTVNQLKQRVMGIKQERKATCTAKAFKFAHDVMFDPSKGVRSATASVKEVIVLTDGHSNCDRRSLGMNIKRLQVKAFVFALAIGNFNTANKKEIESYVSTPLIDHLFSLENFKSFAEMVKAIQSYPDSCVPFELS